MRASRRTGRSSWRSSPRARRGASSSTSSRTSLRAWLLLAGLGAAIVLIDLLGTAGALAGLGAVLAGTVLSAPAAPPPGGEGFNWWAVLAAGAGLLLVGVPL